MGLNSEYKKITEVLVHIPGEEIEGTAVPRDVLYTRGIDSKKLGKEYAHLMGIFEKIGIRAYRVDPGTASSVPGQYVYNLMYTRDLIFMTPSGAVLCNMAKAIRKEEVVFAGEALERLGVPVIFRITGNETFEGADAVWLRDDLVMIGVGNRTTKGAFLQVRACLKKQGVDCIEVASPAFSIHLLGSVQVVDSGLALVRTASAGAGILSIMGDIGIDVVDVPENDEVKNLHSMSILTVSPRRIIMPSGCPVTEKVLCSSGVHILTSTPAREMVNGGGGISCAVAVLSRSD